MPHKTPMEEEKWKRMARALWRLIVRDERLKHLPPKPAVMFSAELDATVCAQIDWDASVVITISTRFLSEIHKELANYREALVKLAAEPGRRNPASERVLEA